MVDWGLVGIAGLSLLLLAQQRRGKHLQVRLAVAEEKNRQIEAVQMAYEEKERELSAARERIAALVEKLSFMGSTQEKLVDTFKALSSEALEKSNRSFLDLAKVSLEKLYEGSKGELDKKHQSFVDLIGPVKEALSKVEQNMTQLEKERKGDQEALKEHLKSLVESEKHLRHETSSLVRALRTPIARGRWGEIQLRRVVELAGMVNYCDFYEQSSTETDGAMLRPDLLVKLPGGRQVVVDAKVPLEAYLDAMQTENEQEKEVKLLDHARLLRNHLQSLSKKAYWEHFQPTPEFVILFLPAESFFSAALESDPSLLEWGAERKVIIATPTTLIALLRSVAYGWKQESLSKYAEEVSRLGGELYKRVLDMTSHWSKVGRNLSLSVEAYNKTVGSIESRVLVTAKKLQELGAGSSEDIDPELVMIEKIPREFSEKNGVN